MHISTLPSLQALIREQEAMARGTLMARRGRGRNECQFWFVTCFLTERSDAAIVWRFGADVKEAFWAQRYPGAWALVLQGK
jgi:hypothetical protein